MLNLKCIHVSWPYKKFFLRCLIGLKCNTVLEQYIASARNPDIEYVQPTLILI